jgi:hypothetical protein
MTNLFIWELPLTSFRQEIFGYGVYFSGSIDDNSGGIVQPHYGNCFIDTFGRKKTREENYIYPFNCFMRVWIADCPSDCRRGSVPENSIERITLGFEQFMKN